MQTEAARTPRDSFAGAPTSAAAAARRRGWLALAWTASHLVLGTWLLVVPDRVTFTLNQLVVLAHVLVATAALPLFGYLAVSHARGATPSRRRPRGAVASQWVLTASVAAACVTGGAALYTGRLGAAAVAHAVCGLLVALPLAAHARASGRRRGAWVVLALAPATALVGGMVRQAVRPLPVEPATPAFAYQTRDATLYDPAAWCGECHREIYAEWSRSLHARTFDLPRVREDLGRFPALLQQDVRDLGAVLAGDRAPPPAQVDGHAVRTIENCIHCHAPASFYGDDRSDALTAPSRQSADAVSCSYCHTLRAVRRGAPRPARFTRQLEAQGEAAYARGLGAISEQEFGAMMSLAVSAPETVRRYLGQGGGRVGRAVAGWLIRWRPEMHRHDYRSPVLRTSEACTVCHGITEELWSAPHQEYSTWAQSRFAQGGPGEAVHCQDCHMAARMTARPTREPGRVTPWSATRPNRRSHWFLGGNSAAQRELGDGEMAAREHAMNRDAVRLRVVELRREGDRLLARVEVRNHHTGHVFPASEDGFRPAWIALHAQGADGRTVARTPSPRRGAPPTPNLIVRVVNREANHVTWDTSLRPDAARTFALSLDLPAGAAVSTVTVSVHHAFDPDPLVSERLAAPR